MGVSSVSASTSMKCKYVGKAAGRAGRAGPSRVGTARGHTDSLAVPVTAGAGVTVGAAAAVNLKDGARPVGAVTESVAR